MSNPLSFNLTFVAILQVLVYEILQSTVNHNTTNDCNVSLYISQASLKLDTCVYI